MMPTMITKNDHHGHHHHDDDDDEHQSGLRAASERVWLLLRSRHHRPTLPQ